MATETTTKLDPESQQLMEAEAARRRDLNAGADVKVPNGSEAAPQPKIDPHEARNAITKKWREKVRPQEVSDGLAAHPAMQEIVDQTHAAIKSGAKNELDRGPSIDTNRNTRAQPQAAAPAAEPDLDKPLERVTVKVNGREYSVPKDEVERAGGTEAYQKQRAASIALTEATKLQTKAKAELEEAARIRQELEQRASAGHGGPATPAAPAQSGQTPPATGASGNGADVAAKAKEFTKALYAGDPKKTEEVIAAILSTITTPIAQVDPRAVAQQAAAILQEQAAKPSGGKETPPEDPAFREQRLRLNAVMKSDYADIMANPQLKAQAQKRLREEWAKPENVGRAFDEVGREVANEVRLSARVERKRTQTLPPPAGGGAAPADVKATPVPTGSKYIEQLRARQGRK